MTPQDVIAKIEEIKQVARDDEAAHGREDDLHQSVLRAIADGLCTDPAECARLALTTLDIDFCRWCA